MRVKPVPRSRDAPLSTGTRWITLADTDSDLTVPGYSRLIDSPDVANAVGMVADIISDATIWLMENTDEGDKRLKNELSRTIDITPYSLGTRQTWVSWIVTTMFTSGDGNAFVLPASHNGRIEELLPMPGATTLPQDNGLSYSIQWRGQMFAPDDVLHFRLHPDPAAPWRGRGPRVQLREVLKNLRQAAATTNAFMSSKWMPSVIIKVDSNSEELRDPSGRAKLKWADAPENHIPTGGNVGQALIKASTSNYALEWGSPTVSRLYQGTTNYAELNSSRAFVPHTAGSRTYPYYLGTSSVPWYGIYTGDGASRICGSSGTLGFYGQTPIARQTLSLSSNNMSYTSVTANNYLYALNNLIGILKNKLGLIK